MTSESPLVDLRAAQVSGNVDRRQMEALPINGRNWMELSMMVKGITANTVTDQPGVNGLANFQLNLDGQEITQHTSVTSFGQPGISRDAIAEYQVVTNMFDVTSGRSAGIQVQAISRAGANQISRAAPMATSATTSSTPRIRSSIGCCRTPTSRSAGPLADRSSRTPRTISSRTSASGNPTPPSSRPMPSRRRR